MTTEAATPTELDLLKERADKMGITYHPSIGLDKLKEKIAAHTSGEVVKDEPVPKGKQVKPKETEAQRNYRLRMEALKLKRVQITCLNPAKASWSGEIISIGNSAIGTIKEFIPFNADEGWHLPVAIIEVLKERKFQSFYTKKVNGRSEKRSKLVREFAIGDLDPLTEEELKTLAAKQAKDEVED